MANQWKAKKAARNPYPTDADVAQERFDRRHEKLKEHFRIETIAVDKQMAHFISMVTMDNDDIRSRQKVMNDLSVVLHSSYPNVRLHPFGSLISRLGDKDSDLDVFVDCIGNGMNGGKSIDNELKTEIFETVFRILKGSRNRGHPCFRQIIGIPAARVPIIKFIHNKTGIHVDASFENILSVRNSQLIQFLIELDPRVFPLMCLVRYWGKFHRITDSQKIKNYGLILLVLVFLKRKRILPSVYKLQHWEPAPPEFKVDCWNGSFYTNKVEIAKFLESEGRPPVELDELGQPTATSILELAFEFFQLYAEFEPGAYVVCTLTAEFIPRYLFLEGREPGLPEELTDYKTYVQHDSPGMRRLTTAPHMSFIVQDPFALNFNVSAVTRENILKHFLKVCESSAARLKHFLDDEKDSYIENRSMNLMEIFSRDLVDETRRTPSNDPPPTPSSFSQTVDYVRKQLDFQQRYQMIHQQLPPPEVQKF